MQHSTIQPSDQVLANIKTSKLTATRSKWTAPVKVGKEINLTVMADELKARSLLFLFFWFFVFFLLLQEPGKLEIYEEYVILHSTYKLQELYANKY